MSDLWVPRDVGLERTLTRTAAAAAGVTPDVADALSDFAGGRAHPGPVRARPMRPEAFEELADCRNYLCWDVQPIWSAFVAGDGAAGDYYEQAMRGLMRTVQAFQELTTASR